MANKRFEMYEYRQIVVRMRQGDSDRALAKAGLIGRPKAKALRAVAAAQGWLDPQVSLPDEAEFARVMDQAMNHPGLCLIEAVMDPRTYGDHLKLIRG